MQDRTHVASPLIKHHQLLLRHRALLVLHLLLMTWLGHCLLLVPTHKVSQPTHQMTKH
jgi:hypothetical protein